MMMMALVGDDDDDEGSEGFIMMRERWDDRT